MPGHAGAPVRVELHCHSTCSDGSLTPAELVERVRGLGVRLFCLTDHDSFAGYPETRALEPEVRVLRGLELSCREGRRTVHLLVYEPRSPEGLAALEAELVRIREQRSERIVRICERLENLGIVLDPEAILQGSHGSTPGRPDVARALLRAGVVSSLKEAFTRFLRDGGPADVAIDRLGVGDGLALARQAGARVSLAHPHTQGNPALVKALFRRFQTEGLEGIEVFYGGYGVAQRRGWLRLAAELGLVVTGGSDFHGEMVPQIRRPGVDLPAEHVDPLLEWLGVELPGQT